MNPAPAPLVVKLGGRALETAAAVAELATDLSRLPGPAILVHGGGAEVSGWCERLGITPRQIDGLRVTEAATLDVVVAVLAGLANKRLVAGLRHAGLDAVGLAALDGGLIACSPHPVAALGHVGLPRAANLDLVRGLCDAGYVPVIASIGALDGELINLNADDVAATIAAAAGARDLVMLSDTPGLVLEGRGVRQLDADALNGALSHPDVSGGMLAKLRSIARALEHGVVRIHVGTWNGPGTLNRAFSSDWEGTQIGALPMTPSRDREPAALEVR